MLFTVTTFFGSVVYTSQSGRLRVVRMELLRNMPHQSIRLDRVLSDSVNTV